MRARTFKLSSPVGAAALLGGLALALRHEPAPRAPAVTRAPVDAAAFAPAGPPGSASAAPTDAGPPAACPEDMALVDGEFCPSLPYDCLRPTGAVGCAEFGRGRRCLEPTDHRRYCVDRFEWPNKVGENPLVYVDWFEAKAYCAGVGKRLCRRSEWMLACEGPKRLPFPWGFVRQPSPCNIDRATFDFDVYAMMDEGRREGELPRLWQADSLRHPPGSVSAYGAYDLTGNVDEWTDDQGDNPGTAHVSTLNGGYWGPVRNTCRLATKSHGPTFKFYQVGFRCCGDTTDGVEVPPPRPWVEHEERQGGPPG